MSFIKNLGKLAVNVVQATFVGTAIGMDELGKIINPKIEKLSKSLEDLNEEMQDSIETACKESFSNNEENEKRYLAELKDFIEDGEISDRERRLLEKLRVQFDISKERAMELESTLYAIKLTEKEEEYLTEYKEIVAEGQVSPRDQLFLDKLKTFNGISDERAKEIEAMILH